MLASRRPTRQRATTPRSAPGNAKFSLRGVLRKARRGKAKKDAEDSEDGGEVVDTPRGVAAEEGHARSVAAVECTDRLFHAAKARLLCPGRWSRLYLASAKRLEARLDRLREAAHVAVALDDTKSLAQLRREVPPLLWQWWSYDLGLVQRATSRCRPEQLAVLPALFGEAYPGYKAIAARHEAIKARPAQGTPQEIQHRQRGEALIVPLRKALDNACEIDLSAMDDILDHPLSGPWKTSDVPACGVNSGSACIDYAGWRPLHFAAAALAAKMTAAPAIRKLIGARADATLVDDSGGTALHLAAARGHLLAVEELLEGGAVLEATDRVGGTALTAAARAREAEVVRRLAAWAFPADACPEIIRSEGEKRAQQCSPAAGTELHVQVAKGSLSHVRQLIVEGDGTGNDRADVNFPDSLGRRPIHTAIHNISGDDRAGGMVRALAAYRADVDARDFEGQTPLHAAVQLQRLSVVRTLLRLRAHPCLPDASGRTALMLAAASPDEHRERPTYDGVLVNRPVTWTTVEDVLEWDGLDDPPGPPPRQTTAPKHLVSTPLYTFKEQKREEGEPEEEAKEQDATTRLEYHTEGDTIRARAVAIAALGFDDQRIIDSEGRVNRGDRLQLFSSLFQKPKSQSSTAATGAAQLQPNERRLRSLWSQLTGPLVQMDLREPLPPRAAEVLQYLLLTMLGKRGAVFAFLVAANSGVRGVSLPRWSFFEQVFASTKNASDRADALLDAAFRGPMPKRAVWVGSTWNRDEYPREPDCAPWGALQYVDRNTAEKLNERNEELSDEAFKENILPVFEDSKSEDAPPVPQRYERLQLANRLFVDEALGMRMFPWDGVPLMLRVVAEERVRAVGLKILCPLLEEAARGLRGGEAAEAARRHRDLLHYVAAQMSEPGRRPEDTPDALRQPFWTAWQTTRSSAAAALSDPIAPQLAALTRVPAAAVQPRGGRAAPTDQAAMLHGGDDRWLRRRHSTNAFFALRRSGAVHHADDFNELLTSLVAMAPRSFGERFWYLAMNLLIWGHAVELRQFFDSELRKHLPAEGVELRGPLLRPRKDVLLAAARDADANAGGAGTGGCRRTPPAFAPTSGIQTEGPTFVAHPNVLPHRVGLIWKAMPPGPLIVESVEPRTWAAEVGFQPGDEIVELNGRKPSTMSADEFALMMTNRPTRLKIKLRTHQAEPIPSGMTDMLRAEVICDDEDALVAAFKSLHKPSHALERQARACASGNPEVRFEVVHVVNGFHREWREKIFAQTASVVLTVHLAVCFPGPEERLLQQLVEVELILATTSDARWMANFLCLDPSTETGPTRVRSPGQPSGFGPIRKRPLY